MANEKKIFRQKTLNRLTSPEQMNDYLRTTKPGIWTLLAVIILILAGFFAWASIGRLETKVSGKATVKDGNAWISISSEAKIDAGMTVRIGETEFTVSMVAEDEYGNRGAVAQVSLEDGNYDAEVVIESISPISFLLSV